MPYDQTKKAEKSVIITIKLLGAYEVQAIIYFSGFKLSKMDPPFKNRALPSAI